MVKKVVVFGWLVAIIFLFFYSFTQIDLGLTLTRASWWQAVQRNFQLIGYFSRPTSAGFYLIILVLLFTFYFLLLKKVKSRQLTSRQIWRLIFLTAMILWFAYNAFSYDLFNYIFDARVITYYQQNPYQHKALDFPGDPMLGFMHWTHRLYPYGPVWLGATIPLSFLGMQKLVPTMILFKSLTVFSYLLSCWAITKILSKINPSGKLLGLAIFAFNPLVVIESLVSSHNDILMIALALLAFWLLLEKKFLPAFLVLLLSVGVKFVTAALLPVFFLVWIWSKIGKKINWKKIFFFSFLLMLLAVGAAIRRDELKPWYLLYPLPFLAFLGESWLFWPMIGFCLGSLLHYLPFLYLGNWNPPVPQLKMIFTIGFLILGLLVGLCGKMNCLNEKNHSL